MRMTATTAAPEETPVTPGSASGLRKTACMVAPATASEAPTSPARRTRGSRMLQTSDCVAGDISGRRWLRAGRSSESVLMSGVSSATMPLLKPVPAGPMEIARRIVAGTARKSRKPKSRARSFCFRVRGREALSTIVFTWLMMDNLKIIVNKGVSVGLWGPLRTAKPRTSSLVKTGC